MWPRPLVLALLLEVIASTVAADTGGHGHPGAGPWATTYAPVPPSVVKTKHHEPAYTAPAPAPPPVISYHYTKGYTPEYTKEHVPEYTKEHTKEYTKEWKETKTYAPHTYTKSYKPHPTPTLPSLEDALINAGCVKFLNFIKSDDDTWALYNSPRVRTVFAPDDVSFDSNSTALRRLRRRELTPEQQQQADLSAETALTDLSALRVIPGTVVETNDNSANLLGSAQVVVSETDSTGSVKIASGLGDEVSLKTTDIAYSGGLIQVTDGLLTPPQLLSQTLLSNPSTSIFASLLSNLGKSNLTAHQAQAIDFTPRITVFIPTDDAIRTAGTVQPNQAAALIAGHEVVSSLSQSVGYLPELKDGQVLKTEGGGSVTISVRNGDYFVGGAKIVQSNLILTNGVAHVVDKVRLLLFCGDAEMRLADNGGGE